jgi:predicted Mrr-cat superfamily restriction endonuclease
MGGFSQDAITKAKTDFVSIRYRDQIAIVDHITKHYEQFEDELKSGILFNAKNH